MGTFTLSDLNRIVNDCEGVDLDLIGQTDETPFSELEIDSLTLVEVAERIASEYRIPVPPEVVEDFRSPRTTVDYVNRHLEGR
ncbi:acyl carrier protein [Nocardiopsis sp. NRRL B-16309]|uniref:acyl carrier protein n=1 Tax=Nocardiopsis sp. NRRL B-16309 TaxID=1519494 RepID=UPI0006AE7D49|nr:acyl carrier protein [Nocardiopsis sp. NRRL B-16309]KOX11684.1 hypothetical protein ADL05_23165 [Nocardiopsis sp. NRRL B-16309]